MFYVYLISYNASENGYIFKPAKKYPLCSKKGVL